MSDPMPPDSTIPFSRLSHCLELMLDDYAPQAKSKHWSDNFTPDFLEKIADEANLKRFRAGRKDKISFGLDDEGRFLATMDTFEDFVASFGKDFLDTYAEARIGSPPTYRIGRGRYNYTTSTSSASCTRSAPICARNRAWFARSAAGTAAWRTN